MPTENDVADFIRSTFRSIWTLELLFLLKSDPKRGWMRTDLVAQLRASDLVVAQGVDALLAAGLITIGNDTIVSYQLASPDLAQLTDAVEQMYRQRPAAVRRIIALGGSSDLNAFANAFRLRRD
jgi:hypothetical protein